MRARGTDSSHAALFRSQNWPGSSFSRSQPRGFFVENKTIVDERPTISPCPRWPFVTESHLGFKREADQLDFPATVCFLRG